MSPWLKKDDAMGEHRKTRRLLRRGKAGVGLMAHGLNDLAMLHASRYMTDGFVDREFVEETLDDANVAGKARASVVDALVSGGQWTATDGGWQIHDYLDHNPSKAEVEAKREAEREKKAMAGRKGAEVRWGRRDDQPGESDGSGIAACQGNDGSAARGADSPVPSRPVPSTDANASGRGQARDLNADRPEVSRLCRLLAELMRANDPKAKVGDDSKGWLDACRLLLDRDGRAVEDVERVIRFTQADEFERTVVLSMPKLRERFPGLLLKAQRAQQAPPHLRPVQGGQQWRQLLQPTTGPEEGAA